MKRADGHESFDEQIPGRIPESLIDAALDGEICDRMQDEIAHALQYDHGRRAELLETADAVRALDLDEIPMPDMQCTVLNQLDQHDRFIPKAMRRWVRTGRLAVAAGVLLGLMLVAGLQSMYPRLTTLGAQSTPVDDVASAVQEDTQHVVESMQGRIEHVRASLSPLDGLLASPGRDFGASGTNSFTLTLNHQVIQLSKEDIEAFYASGVGVGELSPRFPSRISQPGTLTLVSYSGSGDGQLLTGSRSTSLVLIQNDRVERDTQSDERIPELP